MLSFIESCDDFTGPDDIVLAEAIVHRQSQQSLALGSGISVFTAESAVFPAGRRAVQGYIVESRGYFMFTETVYQ